MKHFTIPLIGSGVDLDEIRPNLSAGLLWVGEPHTDNTYIIAVPDDQPLSGRNVVEVRTDQLDAEATRRSLDPSAVRRWRVGPRTTTTPDDTRPDSGSTRPTNPRG